MIRYKRNSRVLESENEKVPIFALCNNYTIDMRIQLSPTPELFAMFNGISKQL